MELSFSLSLFIMQEMHIYCANIKNTDKQKHFNSLAMPLHKPVSNPISNDHSNDYLYLLRACYVVAALHNF